MPLVQDFVPVAERFDQAGMALVSGRGSWLTDHARTAFAPAEVTSVELGPARSLDHAVIVPLQITVDGGPFTRLDGDLRLEPVPPETSHLSLSGTYEMEATGAGARDALNRQRLTEEAVRRFLVAVAATLERGANDTHRMSTASRRRAS
jgi:hypothetical protein